ncbi:hypothetical protein W97_03421 [Coniosporium apollinis CBS 100218]|uniref:GRF-type domain-containing protein n=1 Tax=Coniosporium apollinis (strain CBS 100218) TaxID=1168221 RepID=R7YRC6_CONA1|nr:uncharacterized protein W97_03421 [Coniosporium apollinis CBS 100218]EON64191.1 hypothetical protein W97_03421 [Coniosporium apollinis CBS 100218]
MPSHGMFRARTERGAGSAARGNFNGASRSKPRGVFSDGGWHCECDPPLPATHFKVKKEGPNNGRWFYTCQKGKGKGCSFFLWNEDAKPREVAAVLSNSRDEPHPAPNPVPGATRPITPPPVYSLQAGNGTISRKRSREEDEFGDDDAFPWPLTGHEDDGHSDTSIMPPPETPRKTQKVDAYSTPGKRKLPWVTDEASGLPTPITTGPRKTLFTPSSEPAIANGVGSRSENNATSSPYTTPTPSRFLDTPARESSEGQLATDVFKLLNESNAILKQETTQSLERLFTMHSLKTQGIAKGREISRLAIKAKEARIAELELRVATLEAELETEKAIAQHLRWEKENEVG